MNQKIAKKKKTVSSGFEPGLRGRKSSTLTSELFCPLSNCLKLHNFTGLTNATELKGCSAQVIQSHLIKTELSFARLLFVIGGFEETAIPLVA